MEKRAQDIIPAFNYCAKLNFLSKKKSCKLLTVSLSKILWVLKLFLGSHVVSNDINSILRNMR